MSIFTSAVRRNLTRDHWQSDLYLKDCQEARELIALFGKEKDSKSFISAKDKCKWIEIPFAFDPFWEKLDTPDKRLLSFINLVIDFTENDLAGHMQYLNGQAKNALRDFSAIKV
jgi:hypothetical protein